MLRHQLLCTQKEKTTLVIPNTPLLLDIKLNKVMYLMAFRHTILYLIHFVVLFHVNHRPFSLGSRINLILRQQTLHLVGQSISLGCPSIFPEYHQQPYLLPDPGCPIHIPHFPQPPNRDHAHLRQCHGSHPLVATRVISLQLRLVIFDFLHRKELDHQMYLRDNLYLHNNTLGDPIYRCIPFKVRPFNMVKEEKTEVTGSHSNMDKDHSIGLVLLTRIYHHI